MKSQRVKNQKQTIGKQSSRNTNETVMYCIGWCCIGALALFAVLYLYQPGRFARLPTCIFWQITGFYCPGCGGTRALLALFQGRLLRSAVYHPFVPYSFGVGGWFMISQTVERLSKGRVPIGMKYRDIYLWLALGLVLAGFLLKNILLICGIDLLK